MEIKTISYVNKVSTVKAALGSHTYDMGISWFCEID